MAQASDVALTAIHKAEMMSLNERLGIEANKSVEKAFNDVK